VSKTKEMFSDLPEQREGAIRMSTVICFEKEKTMFATSF